jgi:hypothetical protein
VCPIGCFENILIYFYFRFVLLHVELPNPVAFLVLVHHTASMTPRPRTAVEIPAPYSVYLPSTVLSVFPEKTSSQDRTAKTFLAGARAIVRYNARFLQGIINGGDFSKASEAGIKREEFNQATWNDLLDTVGYRDVLLTFH